MTAFTLGCITLLAFLFFLSRARYIEFWSQPLSPVKEDIFPSILLSRRGTLLPSVVYLFEIQLLWITATISTIICSSIHPLLLFFPVAQEPYPCMDQPVLSTIGCRDFLGNWWRLNLEFRVFPLRDSVVRYGTGRQIFISSNKEAMNPSLWRKGIWNRRRRVRTVSIAGSE